LSYRYAWTTTWCSRSQRAWVHRAHQINPQKAVCWLSSKASWCQKNRLSNALYQHAPCILVVRCATSMLVALCSCREGLVPMLVPPLTCLAVLPLFQGFGKVGGWVARFLHEAGGRVIAVADRKGATLNEKGLDIPRLTGHMARGGSLTDFEGGGPIFSGPNFLTIPCDVLVPAALGGVITGRLAQKLQCKVGGARGHSDSNLFPTRLCCLQALNCG